MSYIEDSLCLRGPRQWKAVDHQAAKDQGLMPTTEGGLNYKLNMTNMLDGYPGRGHTIPVYPSAKMCTSPSPSRRWRYTSHPVGIYGSPLGRELYYETEMPYSVEAAELHRHDELAPKTPPRSLVHARRTCVCQTREVDEVDGGKRCAGWHR